MCLAWEQRKLLDMCSIITKQTGFDYSARIKPSLVVEKNKDTYSFIQNKDFCGNNINFDTDFYIPIEVAKQYPKITLDTPSILVSISGKIGNVGFYNHKEVAFIGGAVGICKLLNEEDGAFSVYELESDYGQKYFQSLIKASSHANITVEDIRNIQLVLPKSDIEKKKIQNLFENIDNLITLHQRKCDKLLNIKKSLLEKMFPKNGNNVPEIRFKGFTEAWEQRKLSEIATMYARIGWQNLRKNEFLDSGKYLLITGTDFENGEINYSTCHYVEKERYIKDKNIQVENGSILITKDGTLGKVALVRKLPIPATLNAGVFNVKNNKILSDNKYVFQYLKAPFLMNYVLQNATGGTIKHLNQNILVDFIVKMPNIDEQRKIGELLDCIDNLITLHQKKLNKLKNIKKSLLEKMFV